MHSKVSKFNIVCHIHKAFETSMAKKKVSTDVIVKGYHVSTSLFKRFQFLTTWKEKRDGDDSFHYVSLIFDALHLKFHYSFRDRD